MATLEASIILHDELTKTASNVINATDNMKSSIEEMQNAMNENFNTSSISEYASKVDECADNFSGINKSATKAGESIKQNAKNQEKYNEETAEGKKNTDEMAKSLSSMVSMYAIVAAGKKLVSFIDECTDAYAEQNNAQTQLMVSLGNMLDEDYVAQFEVEADTTEAQAAIDDLNNQDITVTMSADAKALNAEYNQILDKATEIQNSGVFSDESMVAGAAEFATYFSDADAITTMMDTLSDYAMGMSGGADVDTETMTNYATNLGKIMTGSYDAMTKKGFEFTDAQKAIIEGTATEAEVAATLGDEYVKASDDMKAAAAITQVIESNWSGLYETMSNTPTGAITQLKNSFGDMKETIGGELLPYIGKLVSIINENMPAIQSIVQSITEKLQGVIGVVSVIVDAVGNAISFLIDHWNIAGPIIEGLAGAIIGFAAGILIYKAATGIAAVAQSILNSTMLACPVVWICVALAALVAIIIAVASHIANLSSTTSSAFGVICGWVSVAGAWFKNLGLTVANIALGIWNSIKALANNMQVAFSNSIANIQTVFYNLLSTAMSVIESICSALNNLPFIEFDYSGISSAASSYAAKAAAAQSSKGTYESVSDAFSSGYSTYDTWSDNWKSDAYSAGASWGDSKWSSLSLGSSTSAIDSYLADYSSSDLTGSGTGTGIDDTGTGSNVSDIADSAGNIEDSLSTSDEQLKYLRDIAEQETVNRYTVAEITIDQTNNNSISSTLDLDGVVNGLTDAVNEAVDIVTEGVHN